MSASKSCFSAAAAQECALRAVESTVRSPVHEPMPLARHIRRLGLILLIVGLICRLGRYLLRFPIWCDEATLCENFLNRDFLGLTRQLDNMQVAPILFLWGESILFRLLGGAEWVVRLLPFLAGTAALLLYWRLVRKAVRPLAATLAVGLLAVGRWPVSLSCTAKPYSLDLLMAIALMFPAVLWLERPERPRWLWLLAGLGPLAMGASYPSVFVAGAVVAALVWPVWRQGKTALAPFCLFVVLTGASFLACYLLVGREKAHEGTPDVVSGMRAYWTDGFPPSSGRALVHWLLAIGSGRFMGDDTGSGIITLFFLAGIWSWWRSGRHTLLLLALVPFALNLLAAALWLYPFGASCRLAQHLAPAACLLVGSGLAFCLENGVRSDAWRRRVIWAVFGVLVYGGLAGIVHDLHQSYRDSTALWSREVARQVMILRKANDQVVVLSYAGPEPLSWNLRICGARVAWDGEVNWDRLQAGGGKLWCLDLWIDEAAAPPRRSVQYVLDRAPMPLVVSMKMPFAVPMEGDWFHGSFIHCDLYLCTRPEDAQRLQENMRIPCWPQPVDRDSVTTPPP